MPIPDQPARGCGAYPPTVLLHSSSGQTLREVNAALGSVPCTLRQAAAGAEGLDGLGEGPALLLLDLPRKQAPGLIDALGRLVARGRGCITPVVLVDSGDVRTAVDAMRAGAAEVLQRPLQAERLAALAQRAFAPAQAEAA